MKQYEKPEFHIIRNSGGLNMEQIEKLSDSEMIRYLAEDSMLWEKRKYRIRSDFILREIAGEYAIVPVGGDDNLFTNTMMAPNDSAVFLWKAFGQPSTVEDVTVRGMQEYEVTEEVIRKSTENFIRNTLEYKILEEVE